AAQTAWLCVPVLDQRGCWVGDRFCLQQSPVFALLEVRGCALANGGRADWRAPHDRLQESSSRNGRASADRFLECVRALARSAAPPSQLLGAWSRGRW